MSHEPAAHDHLPHLGPAVAPAPNPARAPRLSLVPPAAARTDAEPAGGAAADNVQALTARIAVLEAQIEAQQRQYRAIVDNIEEVVYRVDVDRAHGGKRLSFLSGAATELFGCPPQQPQDERDPLHEHVHPDDVAHLRVTAVDTLADKSPTFRTYRVHAPGEAAWRWVEDKIVPLFDDRGGVCGYQGIARDITERREAQEALERLALFDALTGLPNRVLFQDRLRQALLESTRYKRQVAVLLLDLNEFKDVNDSYGHPVGDMLLGQVADRLRASVRESDTVARLGGDEFAVILPHVGGLADAEIVANRIGDQFSTAFRCDSYTVRTGVSIGITVSPDHGSDANTLLRQADIAMYVAKKSARRYTVFNRSYAEPISKRAEFIAQIGDASTKNQLLLHYQPQVQVDTGDVEWVEALLRWRHPSQGLLSMGEFLRYLERSSALDQVTRWAVEQAVKDAAAWQQRNPRLGVAVNLTPRVIRELEFASWLESVLQHYNLPPSRVKLEIAETALTTDHDRVERVLARLAGSGVQVAVDDFGVGASGIAYLKRLPLTQIKIDRELVGGLLESSRDASIVKAVIEMAHSLGIQVLAAGVERDETLEALRALECDSVQGYLVSRPLAKPRMLNWLYHWQQHQATWLQC